MKTQEEAVKASKEHGFDLLPAHLDGRQVWVAKGQGKSCWASKKVYAAREWMK